MQVAPAELEQLLQSHPEIVDAAVIPLVFTPLSLWGSFFHFPFIMI